MNKVRFMFSVLSILFVSIQAKVISVVGQDQLDKIKKDHLKVVIKFYRPTCPACKEIAKPFVNVSDDIDLKDVLFASVDLNNKINKSAKDSNNIAYVPTIRIYKDGVMQESRARRKRGPYAHNLKQELLGMFQ